MTTTDLEQLMQAHKCGFAVFTCDGGYCCELYSYPEQGEEMVGHGSGPTIVEAVYEALKSKMGARETNISFVNTLLINEPPYIPEEIKAHDQSPVLKSKFPPGW